MFQYYYRIYDKYQKPITAFAILTETNKRFKPLGEKKGIKKGVEKGIEVQKRLFVKTLLAQTDFEDAKI